MTVSGRVLLKATIGTISPRLFSPFKMQDRVYIDSVKEVFIVAVLTMGDNIKMDLIAHIEQYLGELEQGWKDSDESNNIRVINFLNRPFSNITTYSTLGLSKYVLP